MIRHSYSPQTKGEVVYFCCYSQDPATGARKAELHKLGPPAQFPDAETRWQEVGRRGLASFFENPVSDVTFEDLYRLPTTGKADRVGIKLLSDAEQQSRKTKDNGVRVFRSSGEEIKA